MVAVFLNMKFDTKAHFTVRTRTSFDQKDSSEMHCTDTETKKNLNWGQVPSGQIGEKKREKEREDNIEGKSKLATIPSAWRYHFRSLLDADPQAYGSSTNLHAIRLFAQMKTELVHWA